MSKAFENLLALEGPVLALAPMQDVTDLPFWRLMTGYGGADVYYTEYFRVHPTSHLESWIAESIVQNPTGKPVIAQMIGNDLPSLIKTARELEQLPITGIDLNLGCPAPVVYRKCAGGGLLRDPEWVDRIVGGLRQALQIPFTVKTRIGFENRDHYERLLSIFEKHKVDLVTVHGRTVKEMYGPVVHYDAIAMAVQRLSCPVLANGNVWSSMNALEIWKATGARGLMIGRGAIRNPWIFQQIRQQFCGEQVTLPSGGEVLDYVVKLYNETRPANFKESLQVQKMKKYMNHLGAGVESPTEFLHDIRRADTEKGFFAICEQHLQHDRPMQLSPADPSKS